MECYHCERLVEFHCPACGCCDYFKDDDSCSNCYQMQYNKKFRLKTPELIREQTRMAIRLANEIFKRY